MSLRETLVRCTNLERAPGLSEQGLHEFQHGLPGRMPREVEDLLRYASGFHSKAINYVDFTGQSYRFEFKEIAPNGLAIAQTNEGNFWAVDVKATGDWGEVFYFSHDPPVVAVQFDSLEGFIEAADGGDQIVETARVLADEIWRDRSAGAMATEIRKSSDETLAQFARSLPDNFRLFDLRGSTAPRGFAWGRAGPQAHCRRLDHDLIFAVEESSPTKGFLKKLLRR
jgi:hypothetical protein